MEELGSKRFRFRVEGFEGAGLRKAPDTNPVLLLGALYTFGGMRLLFFLL